MAFIVLRRSRNTSSYYLVESYRDRHGRSRKRTLCYLGREQDDTDTLAKAIDYWQKELTGIQQELRKAKGERRRILRNRRDATTRRLDLLRKQKALAARAEAERERRAEQAQEAPWWGALYRFRRAAT